MFSGRGERFGIVCERWIGGEHCRGGFEIAIGGNHGQRPADTDGRDLPIGEPRTPAHGYESASCTGIVQIAPYDASRSIIFESEFMIAMLGASAELSTS